jgi:hypothetical protein
MTDKAATEKSPRLGYEVRDVRMRPILLAGAGLGVAVVLVQVGMWLLFQNLSAREALRAASDRPLAAELRRAQPPEPRLQTSPRDDLVALHAWEDRALTTYGIVDGQAGIVRIPIERAMDLIAERGLPKGAR